MCQECHHCLISVEIGRRIDINEALPKAGWYRFRTAEFELRLTCHSCGGVNPPVVLVTKPVYGLYACMRTDGVRRGAAATS